MTLEFRAISSLLMGEKFAAVELRTQRAYSKFY